MKGEYIAPDRAEFVCGGTIDGKVCDHVIVVKSEDFVRRDSGYSFFHSHCPVCGRGHIIDGHAVEVKQ